MARPVRASCKSESVEVEHVRKDLPMTPDLAEELSSTKVTDIKDEPTETPASSTSPHPIRVDSSQFSPSSNLSKTITATSIVKNKPDELDDKPTPKMEPMEDTKPLKATRPTKSQPVPRVAALFDYLPDATAEATSTFVVMESCTYSNKYLGYTEHAMECDCSEEWDSSTRTNHACGEDSDCINRATKMECVGDCACGSACRNQRFQQHEYANVSVIKTEKKGHGLRTNTDLRPGDFIFEYIGEVINEPQFRRRMLAYDEQGIKHFYFMSLSKGEFVDATKKGNLGRFCNHSCNPNCYVDKWVVGDKLRMGIFAEKQIKAGEELVFNYNVDRYGANPQPCYCGESNCTGFIGGKTQTERATKLSTATIEALGIEDADSWDTTVAKKPKKKKTGEDDEEYVESVEAKELEADGVTKVMAALMQCKEKWIAVKLLQRIQRCKDEQVRNRVVKVHGYQILNSQLAAWKEDENVVLQILDILDHFPRITRNKIIDSKIETTLQPFITHQDERVSEKAVALLDSWAKLEVAYRIPRKKRELEDAATPVKREPITFDRRESSRHERRRSRSRTRSVSPPRGPSGASIPSGPKSSLPQRNQNYYQPRPPAPRLPPPTKELPPGWFEAKDKTGKVYYYNSRGSTTWQRPTLPAIAPPPPPKAPSQQDVLKNIIDNIITTKEKEKDTTPETPNGGRRNHEEKKQKKWETYDEEKKKKLYENTLFPHISHVMNKYKHKIPKDDLKRFAKDISKKLSASDFKAGRVKDPTKLDEKHVAKVKRFCKDFFDKAAYKHKKHERAKTSKDPRLTDGDKSEVPYGAASPAPGDLNASPDLDDEVKQESESEDEAMKTSGEENSPSPDKGHINGNKSLKRKRLCPDGTGFKEEDEDLTQSPLKKPNLSETGSPPPPPPPPAPPADTPPQDTATPEPQDADMPDIHAGSSFKSKSMADVLAEAQADEGEDDMDTGRGTANHNYDFVNEHMKQETGEVENLLVDEQLHAAPLQNAKDELVH